MRGEQDALFVVLLLVGLVIAGSLFLRRYNESMHSCGAAGISFERCFEVMR
jgi:hypothetical protein